MNRCVAPERLTGGPAPLPAWQWLKPSANCEDCTGRFPIWAQKGTKGHEKDRKGMKGHKRDQKGMKGIVSSNYVRAMVEGTTGEDGSGWGTGIGN